MSWESFYIEYKKFKIKQSEQKSRGLNDYNLFATLLSYSDEVRLHSRFIYSLINPEGEHYQGTLFLSTFLDSIQIPNCDMNLSLVKVYKEHKNIDLYITDGHEHIIIENKIFAGDQDRQITRYIQTIADVNNSNDILSRISVVYLSLNGKEPSNYSIDGYELKNGFLMKKDTDQKIRFVAATYRDHIMKWLQGGKKEVSNLTNLNQTISQYEDVVRMLYGEYKGNCMMIEDFVGNDIDKWNMMNEMANKRDELLFKGLGEIAKQLWIHIEEKSESSQQIEGYEVLSKNGAMYADGIYMNLYLSNKLIIQLEYSLTLKMRQINVQFYKLEEPNRRKPERRKLNGVHNSEYAPEVLICDKGLLSEWVQNHDHNFIKKIDNLIEEFSKL